MLVRMQSLKEWFLFIYFIIYLLLTINFLTLCSLPFSSLISSMQNSSTLFVEEDVRLVSLVVASEENCLDSESLVKFSLLKYYYFL